MTPFFFKTDPAAAQRILKDLGPEGVRVYGPGESQAWVSDVQAGIADDNSRLPNNSRPIPPATYLTGITTEAVVEGRSLVGVDLRDPGDLAALALRTQTEINPV